MEKIVKKFKEVNGIQETLIQLSEQKFLALQHDDKEAQKKLIQQEALKQFDFEEACEQLKASIREECQKKQVTNIHLESLVPFMTKEEKDELMACRRCAIRHDRKLKAIQKMNGGLAQSLAEAEKLLLDAILHVAEQEDVGGNLFINKEL